MAKNLAGISILLVRRRKNTPLSARLATFFAFVPTAKPPSCPAGPLPRPKSPDLPHFEAISRTLLRQLPSFVQIGFAWLPRLSSVEKRGNGASGKPHRKSAGRVARLKAFRMRFEVSGNLMIHARWEVP